MRPLAARRSVGARRWRAGDGRRGVLHRGPRGAARSGGGAVPTARESASLRRRLRQPSTMEPGHDQAPTMMTREAEAAQNNSNRNQRNHDHAPLSSLSPSTILHHRRRPVVVNVEQFQRIVQGRGNQVKPRACRRGGKAVEQRAPPPPPPPPPTPRPPGTRPSNPTTKSPCALPALYAGAVGGCLSNAMRAGSTDHRNEVWCSQRPLEIACALPANFLWPRA